MNLNEYLQHPLLKQFVKHVPKSTVLFQQGQLGNTMFIILGGTVELLADRDGEEHVFALVEAGQFLGEKALTKSTPHQRVFGARAQTELLILELALKDVAIVYNLVPDVMMDIMKRMFQVAAERLDRSNFLTRLLRSSDNIDRLKQLILFFARTSGIKTDEGTAVNLTAESIHYYIDLPIKQVNQCLKDMDSRGIIKAKGNHTFIISDPNLLLNYLPATSIPVKKAA